MEIAGKIQSSIGVKQRMLEDTHLMNQLVVSVQHIVDAYRNGRKVLLCGNGGSAADAQHLAAELTGRFYLERAPLQAEALHTNVSFLTATANDDSFIRIYERMVQASGREGDVLMAFSTSGASPNILAALKEARNRKMLCIGFGSERESPMDDLCHVVFKVPSKDTPRIQEAHMLLGHIICEHVEKKLFEGADKK